MKFHFNKFEKVAGLFVLLAIVLSVGGVLGVAIKNGWLASKVHFVTELDTAEGVHVGTVVQISGLRVGSVRVVELEARDRVRVEFAVLEKFASKIREDSKVQLYRPFVLADKVLDVSVGDEELPQMAPGSKLTAQSSNDILDLISGKKMGAMFASFDKLAESLTVIGEAFANPKRTRELVKMLDRLNPLVNNLNVMSGEVVKIMSSSRKEIPDMGRQIGQLVKNMNNLTTEVQKLTPAIGILAPELPRTTKRAVEALDETVILLKAMQQSWMLRGKVQDVRDEELKKRQPATKE